MYHDPIERTASWVRDSRGDKYIVTTLSPVPATIVELKISCDTSAARRFVDAMLQKVASGIGLTAEELGIMRDFVP